MLSNKNNIKVFVRVKPLINQLKNQRCVNIESEEVISIVDPESNSKTEFKFDQVFDEYCSQEQIYMKTTNSMIQKGLQGINGTILGYGQTGSGKTYTCVGGSDKQKGLLPRAISKIMVQSKKLEQNIEFHIKISVLEIYNEKVKDLLDVQKNDLKIRCNKTKGIFVENATQMIITSQYEGMQVFMKGLQNRSVGSTNMNILSSRSHMVFIISLYQNNRIEREITTSKITFVDLAGSEKISKSGSQGKLLQEAKQINKSLTSLGKVINSLSDPKITHIPYRDSKLTRLLQESLGGNSLTLLIVNVSQSIYNQTQTFTSLRFGLRAKSIQNKPKVNKQHSMEEILKLLERAQLKIKNQRKIIQSYQKYKEDKLRYNNSMITLHILEDQSSRQQIQKNIQSQNSITQDFLSNIYRQTCDNLLKKNYEIRSSISEIFQDTQQNSMILSNIDVNLQKSQRFTKNVIKPMKNEEVIKIEQIICPKGQINIDTNQDRQRLKSVEAQLKWTTLQYHKMKIKYGQAKAQNAIHQAIIERKNMIIENLQQKCRN